jgi:predicted AlkP superfamily phosphohydrolase/phosphomutase
LRTYLGGSAATSKARIFEDLQPGSEILQIDGKVLRSAAHIDIVTCIEQRRTSDDGDVHVDTREAMTFSRSEKIVPIDEYHKDMNKFGYTGQDGFQAVLTYLLEALAKIPAPTQGPL